MDKDLQTPADPYIWLEEIDAADSMAWVTQQNEQANRSLASSDDFISTRDNIREVLDSVDKIPPVVARGELLYNFWTDAEHPRGVWRRTTLEEYRTPNPQWEVLLDVDALNETESQDWVWHGATLLRPDYALALISLSHGGSDADVTREFDLTTKSWVADGFLRPESKGGMGWINADEVYVYTDTGPGSMTESGYPRTARRWRRGTELVAADLVFEGGIEDLSVSAVHDHTPGFERDLVVQALTFYTSRCFVITDGELTRIDIPESAELGVKREWLLIELRDPWQVGGQEYPAGALLAARFDDFMAGSRELTMVFEPEVRSSLASVSWTKSFLVLNILRDVRNDIQVLRPPSTGEEPGASWTPVDFTGATEFGSTQLGAVDSNESDALWIFSTDFLTPTTLSRQEIGGPAEILKSMPSFFDASGLTIEQSFASSVDGTRVPYFLVRQTELAFDGEAPTLLYGYGGFEVSMTPGYSGALGRSWLARGGVYVLANIRGGGEYGPTWHQAALKQNRHRAYEDFAAVAQDLVARRVTSPSRLGIQGGSNGGLLTGNMLVSYPELFGAIAIQVPLLDMRRYSQLLAGASWMAEYGDPDDPAQWEFIREFSPYHLTRSDLEYPPVLMTTSTRDDRVHPGHARKMTALLLEQGRDITYYENIEGGHGGAADNAQAAHMSALAYSFLWKTLGPS